MKKLFYIGFILLFALNPLFANSVNAYTYGDPNEEELATVYNEMLIQLDKNPPDFATAKKHFETVKKEIDMHMGPEPAKIILQNLEDKDKENTIKNMEKLLVLNIARRLENVDKNFAEYETSKRLLAKGFATYKALSPKVDAENAQMNKEINEEFDKALASLGNPGLFGVGKREADKVAFNESKDKVLTSLQKQFQIKSLEVGHFSESATETKTEKKEWTDISNLKNWIPIILIVGVIASVIILSIRKKNRK
ncbi:hypothetical protein [Peribacillus alkalitolerans]|uniref:hypothetical protein n=1 Tax=Peribacillus alkalitolerans TaxID=1550385 RepID=UPI0013D3EA73|nr:hypothetical protein [Peribacillus alkalitolerans]